MKKIKIVQNIILLIFVFYLLIFGVGCEKAEYESDIDYLNKHGYTFIINPTELDYWYKIYNDTLGNVWLIHGKNINKKIKIHDGQYKEQVKNNEEIKRELKELTNRTDKLDTNVNKIFNMYRNISNF